VALTNVVLSGVPFQFTTAPLTKLLPLTVRVKLVPPAAVLVGKSELIVGTGLSELGSTECEEQPMASRVIPTAPRMRSRSAASRNPSILITLAPYY
jgi:hypothetical protein